MVDALHADPTAFFSKMLGRPVTITSAARSAAHNAAVGGSDTSEHLTGNAWDMQVPGMTHDQIVQAIRASGVKFDQLIDEPDHVHFGIGPKMRNAVMKLPGGQQAMTALDQAITSSGAATQSLDKDPLFQRAFAEVEKANKARGSAAESVAANMQRKAALLDKPLPAIPPAPKLNDLPKPIDEQLHSDPMRVFGQFMPMMAAFGSLLTRTGAVGALTSATAAMNAATAKDKDALERAHTEWMDHTKQTLDQNSLEVERYRAAMDRHGTGMSDRLALMQEIAADNQDHLMLSQLQANPDGVMKLLETRDKAAEHLWTIYDKAQDHDLKRASLKLDQDKLQWEKEHGPVDQQVYNEWRDANPKATPEEQLGELTRIQAAKFHGKSGPAAAAATFLNEFQQAEDDTEIAYGDVTATRSEWEKAVSDTKMGVGTGQQMRLAKVFTAAVGDAAKITTQAAAAPKPAAAAAAPKQRPLAPTDPAERKKGWVYQNASGQRATWDGEHWIPYNGA